LKSLTTRLTELYGYRCCNSLDLHIPHKECALDLGLARSVKNDC
jgi:hypothetical protein